MIPDWASSGAPLIIFLFFVVLLRAQGTYWLGRLAARGALAGADKSGVLGRLASWFTGPTPRRGAALLEKWGLVVIPLCFLTVGVQTAVNAGAGVVRMRWRTYTLCMLPGCVLWALMYGLGLLAVWTAAITAVAGSPWGWAGMALVVALVWWRVASKRRARRAPGSETPEAVLDAPVPALDSRR
ncbi:hypothetical protein M3T53_03270 [Actinomyces sp. B33]|uniref:DedA family protein n=1 Tax=Actinomyces sp. B33 TaxID=2942131 RepID=UPI00233FA419|nr:hypothetical protein [Actinomyces sp. B33]MDC4232737.1 hypothetical protein [Actinomyces sp. B33]